MTRLLILGAGGMFGHKLAELSKGEFDVFAAFRASLPYRDLPTFEGVHVVDHVDAIDIDSIHAALSMARPDAVVNCIGIVKQLTEAHDPVRSILLNAFFPHRLAAICSLAGARMIHISTDCVFSGQKGMYTEGDPSDAEDIYGRTKYLGEVKDPPALTLRTSIIGRELHTRNGLIEWFLSNRNGSVRGFTKAMYSGVTTNVLARLMVRIIRDFPDLSGLYHVASQPISKYDLLMLTKSVYGLPVQITPDPGVVIDRSLNGEAFRRATGFEAPSWPAMIREMAEDPTPYDEWRSTRGS